MDTERDPVPPEDGTDGPDPSVPSMLELIRLSPRNMFPPGGVDLYRQIALLADLSPGDELLDVGSGVGTPLVYWVQEYGIQGSGVDTDRRSVVRAETRVREEGLAESLQFQEGSPENLPYRDEIFDVVVGEMSLTAEADPERAIRELVRVTKPGGRVALIQLVWKAPVDSRRRAVLSEHLGARPHMLVELKRMLREAGVRNLHTEDWSDEETAFRGHVTKPFPDFAELFTLPEKLGILRRAWRRWGWKGVKAALLREREVHDLLTRERIIGLDLILGRKVEAEEDGERQRSGRRRRGEGARARLPDAEAPSEDPGRDGRVGGRGRSAGSGPGGVDEDDDAPREDREGEKHEDTVGLPLFGGGEDDDEDEG